MNTSVDIGKLKLKNPVTVASGTAGYGEELCNFIDISHLGAIFTKGLSIKERPGNKGNRIMETPSGMLNSIGLENVGIDEFISKKLPFLLKKKATVIPNIAGHSIDENIELCKVLSGTSGIDAVELNVSCPNVKEGGIAFGTDLKVFSDLVKKARAATSCALIVKLSPNVTDITEFAQAAEDLGADAISAVNTFLGMKIDIKTGKPHFNNKVAGLSGPAIRPLAVRVIYQIYEKVNIPIIGLGGISSFEDMLEFIMAGASAVSIGTMGMINPQMSIELIEKVKVYMKSQNITGINDIVGIAH
ncbi:dihydroorotate dehydrogenase [Spirochaetota bacterium]